MFKAGGNTRVKWDIIVRTVNKMHFFSELYYNGQLVEGVQWDCKVML